MARKQNKAKWRRPWTPERRKRHALAIQNWKPWLSGGAKKGETRQRLNALKHGARSAELREIAAALTRIERAMRALKIDDDPPA